MNFTFLIILLFWVTVAFLLKNLFGINVKGYRRDIWVLLVISVLILMDGILVISEAAENVPHFYLLTFSFKFIVGPFLFLLIYRHQKPRKAFSKIHYIPSITCFLILSPIYIADAGKKLQIINDPPAIVAVLGWGVLISLAFYLVRVTIYIYAREPVKTSNSWIPFMSLLFFLILQTIAALKITESSLADIISSLQLSIGVVAYKILESNKPKPQIVESRILEKIEEAMRNEKLYLRQDLTLQVLSDFININTNKISGSINSSLSSNFNDYVNEYRVNEVIKLLQDKENAKFTLEAVSKMAGFNSSTTFNIAFRKVTGKTPREYKF